MAVEIERKFLVVNDNWRELADSGTVYTQGYLVGSGQSSVRIRIEGDNAFINIKSATLGIRRQEYEYHIPVSDATEMLETLCEKPLIRKIRYHLNIEEFLWEIDEFDGENKGLIVAEIELKNETEEFLRPDWIGEEVSHDPKYYNVSLVKCPFSQW